MYSGIIVVIFAIRLLPLRLHAAASLLLINHQAHLVVCHVSWKSGLWSCTPGFSLVWHMYMHALADSRLWTHALTSFSHALSSAADIATTKLAKLITFHIQASALFDLFVWISRSSVFCNVTTVRAGFFMERGICCDTYSMHIFADCMLFFAEKTTAGAWRYMLREMRHNSCCEWHANELFSVSDFFEDGHEGGFVSSCIP